MHWGRRGDDERSIFYCCLLDFILLLQGIQNISYVVNTRDYHFILTHDIDASVQIDNAVVNSGLGYGGSEGVPGLPIRVEAVNTLHYEREKEKELRKTSEYFAL